MANKKYKTIDEYIKTFPEEVQSILEAVRQAIRSVAPEAEELISYQMPAFKQNGILVYFAGYKHHIGFYPTSSGIKAFKKDIEPYKSSKGAVQFLIDKPIPYDLVKKIVLFRLKENQDKIQKS